MIFQKWINRRVEAYQSDLIRKYCDEVEAIYKKMRGWRHDYHNHIQALQASMALGKYDEVDAYLHQLNDDLTGVDTVIKTGRVMVDAILNGKLNIAAQNEIPVNAKAKLPDGTPVTDVDMCVIIGNLLDNAIEENEKLAPQERFIRVYIGRKKYTDVPRIYKCRGKKTETQRKTVCICKGIKSWLRACPCGRNRKKIWRAVFCGQRGWRIYSGNFNTTCQGKSSQ